MSVDTNLDNVNQGSPNTAANAWPEKITDGTNVAAVKPASTAAVTTDPALVIAVSPNNTVTVGGTVITTPPANASTNVTQFGGNAVVTGTGAAGNGVPRVTVSSDSFPATQAISGSVSVSNLPATQPISAVSLPLPTNAAQETGGNLTALVTLTTLMTQLIEIEKLILCVLEATRIQHAAFYTAITSQEMAVNPSMIETDVLLN